MTESAEQRIGRLKAELAELEGRYAAAEARQGHRTAASARRGPISLIAVCLGLALAVGAVAAIDLRRLQTPAGAARAWTGATVFGDCTAFRELSSPVGTEPRAADEVCRALRTVTEQNRRRAAEVEIEVLDVAQDGDGAEVRLRLDRPLQRVVEVPLQLRRTGDDWRVLLTAEACGAVGCP